jgi:hypothetical protein
MTMLSRIKQEEKMSGNVTDRAMLASLHISSWSGMAVDREVTDNVNESYKAAKEAGSYSKRLVASSFLNGVSTAHSQAKAAHRLYTLPWDDDGTRILASSAYFKYQALMKDCREKVQVEVRAFLTTRDEYIKEGRTRLGKMFNVDDYPDDETVESKFGFDIELSKVPEAGDFRVDLSAESVKAISKDIERRTNARLEAAMNEIFERVTDVVSKMSERLREYSPAKDGKKATGIIRDSVVYNVNQLADLLPTLNITNDPRIDTLQKQLKADLVANSPEIIRADTKVRQQTITAADKILKKVQQYMK